jgi:alpha-beta hydrolase superfamily lysophospholipase
MILNADDGVLLHCLSQRAAKPWASLLIVHGLGEHLGRYDSFAEEMLGRGISVHRIDLRGHGRSGGARGHVERFSQFYADIEAWIKYLESSGALNTGVPTFLFGHSLGGLIATGFLARRTNVLGIAIVGLILSSPGFAPPATPKSWVQKWLSGKIPHLIGKIQIPNGISPDDLSHDKNVIAAYLDDPLVHPWITPGLARSYFAALGKLDEYAKGLRAPILTFLAGEDRVVSNRATEQFIAQVQLEHPLLPVTLKRFPGAFHEIFNESHKQKYFSTLADWIQSCLASQKRPATSARSKPNSLKSSKTKATGKATLS